MRLYNETILKDKNSSCIIFSESKEMLNMILFIAGKLVSLLGTYIYSFAISLYILKVTGSGTSFAFSILIGTLPRIILSPVAGSLTDRINKKKMIVVLDFLSGAVIIILLVSCVLYGIKIPFIYVTTFILAVISTFFNTCFSAAIPRLVSDRKLVKINSYNRAIDSGSSILGPVLAGMVFGLVSMNLFLLINGLSFILSAISELFIDFDLNKSLQVKPPVVKMSIKAILQDIKDVFTFIKKNPLLSLIMPFSITFNFLITACLAVVLPYLINSVLGMTSSQYGLIEGSFSVGMLIAAIVVGKLPEKQKKRKRLVRGFIGMGLSMILLGIPGIVVIGIPTYINFVVYIIVSIFFAFFLLSIDLPLSVVVQRSIPDFMLGRVMGVWGMITSCLSPIGILLAGFTLDIIPAYAIFFVSGIYCIISSVILSNSKALIEY